MSLTLVTFGTPVTLQSPGTITTTSCTGTITKTTGSRQLPDVTHVFDYYTTNGTSIAIGTQLSRTSRSDVS